MSCTQVASDSVAPNSNTDPTINVVTTTDLKWEQLNPARGANSPMAATLWGDRTGPGPSGFLLKPVDGFKSPPHVHTANYHGLVIKGSIHNAEPDAQELYLGPGSFWTQPGGGVHITAAKGSSIAYIEVEDTFDVLPADKKVKNDKTAVVMPASSIDWVNLPNMPSSSEVPKMAVLWGNPYDDSFSGTLVKIPAGFTATMRALGSTLHAVVIQGEIMHRAAGQIGFDTLGEGGYFGSNKEYIHETSCLDEDHCIIYLRNDGKLEVLSANLER
ncbi:MAG: DUF4437 domain-containing protein [Thermodesulfobacteriota bacterium]